MSKAFDKIAGGLTDAIAYAAGDTSKGRVAASPDVKAIRAKTRLSQAKFAARLRVPVATVRDPSSRASCGLVRHSVVRPTVTVAGLLPDLPPSWASRR